MEKSIEEIIRNIIILLKDNDEPEWAGLFGKIMFEYKNNEKRTDTIKNIINFYKGGMGSFADLVLQKNMKMLIEENDKLAALKHELYSMCLNYCKNNNIN